jgi:hypothetical protein
MWMQKSDDEGKKEQKYMTSQKSSYLAKSGLEIKGGC